MSDLVLYECTARRRCRCPRFCYRYSLERCNDEGSWFQLPKFLDLNRLTRGVVRLHRYLIVSGENGSTLCDGNEPGATLGLVFSKAFQVSSDPVCRLRTNFSNRRNLHSFPSIYACGMTNNIWKIYGLPRTTHPHLRSDLMGIFR